MHRPSDAAIDLAGDDESHHILYGDHLAEQPFEAEILLLAVQAVRQQQQVTVQVTAMVQPPHQNFHVAGTLVV